jgi:hypothetical protein
MIRRFNEVFDGDIVFIAETHTPPVFLRLITLCAPEMDKLH